MATSSDGMSAKLVSERACLVDAEVGKSAVDSGDNDESKRKTTAHEI